MANREIKDQRRKVGPADPATRRALIRKEMGLDKAPTQRAKPEAPERIKPAAPDRIKQRSTAIASGLKKLVTPKDNIERKLAELGE